MNGVLRVTLAGVLQAAIVIVANAEDWPQWQGAIRDGKSNEMGLLTSWDEGGPPRQWLYQDCGYGFGGPAIVGDRLYIMGTRHGEEFLFCLDTETGSELFKTKIGALYENDWGDGPRGTPTVVDGKIYALAARGNLACVNASTGEEIWSTSLLDIGGKIPEWGYAESPLVLEDRVLCTPGGSDGAIVALDRANGQVIWRCEDLSEEAHYSSLVLAEDGGRRIAVQLLASQLVGVDPEHGELLWSLPWGGTVAVVPTPTVRGKEVYASSGYGAGCMLIRLNGSAEPEVIFSNKLMSNHHGGIIRLDDYVYGYADGKGWLCQSCANGKRVWREREAFGKGAISYADGHFYCLSEDDGEVALVEPSPDGWEERGRFRLSPQTELRKPEGKIWTHPVIANGRLYLRDLEYVFCYDIQDKTRSSIKADGP
ncbi:PQQ-binding-like beta-propeller repeat protein [Bythopirellula goksoeyrii]|uniref:Alcohol dehydrogenase [cytochrome c] n=1 Tax=Bythopirellula goksoeyrii TaxID=1400387 RepID=A0A5B9QTD5_9BACT|nr:PQQ-binding-like beta-propeller repeat protein [Bythopirellula goksoeyrii]QEG37371.1 Alcohol dehydrogenase [cytochrome c] precursor [Bythopirellula goksoeyrii]